MTELKTASEKSEQPEESPPALVEIKHLVKQFGKLRAINDLDLTIQAGKTFAQNEFQIIQFIPLVFGIQILLSGIFWPIAQLPYNLRYLSYILPLTYANEALRDVMLKNADIGAIGSDLIGLILFALVMIGLSSLTTRRQLA